MKADIEERQENSKRRDKTYLSQTEDLDSFSRCANLGFNQGSSNGMANPGSTSVCALYGNIPLNRVLFYLEQGSFV